MSNIILKTVGLSHKYSANWAIEDINIELKDNEILGLLGSNGAGKSTTMNIICGVLNQTEGDVFINGINLRENPIEAKRCIGFLPQKPPVYPDLTVEEYLTHTAYLRLVPEKEISTHLEDALTRCGLQHMRSRLIRNLSGGYQQRVGIAQAIIHKPKLVIFDEPTTGLDPNNIAGVKELIKHISTDTAVILCSHILPDVQEICKTIKMIEDGKLVFSDSVEAFNDYVEPDTITATMLNPPTKEELEKLAGVKSVEFLRPTEVEVKFDITSNVSAQIIELGVKNNWQLQEVSIKKQSLDLIFAHLSRKVK